MESFTQIIALLAAAVLVWLLYRGIRANPESFSKKNLMKSFSTMGFLALGLIVFVTLCIILLRAG